MADREHAYDVRVVWTGDRGEGTSSYRGYARDHEIIVDGRPPIFGSSDPAFRGDPLRYNPEELLVASLSACHMLWYLHLCADAGIVVTGYIDDARGTMNDAAGIGGRFTEVVLRPRVEVQRGMDLENAAALHSAAHRHCFIARSVNFPVRCEPIAVGAAPAADGKGPQDPEASR